MLRARFAKGIAPKVRSYYKYTIFVAKFIVYNLHYQCKNLKKIFCYNVIIVIINKKNCYPKWGKNGHFGRKQYVFSIAIYCICYAVVRMGENLSLGVISTLTKIFWCNDSKHYFDPRYIVLITFMEIIVF